MGGMSREILSVDAPMIAARLRAAGIACANSLAALARPSLRIRTEKTSRAGLPLGASRFGGSPDVTPGFVVEPALRRLPRIGHGHSYPTVTTTLPNWALDSR